MKRKLFLSLIVVFFTMSLVGCNNQTPTKEGKSVSQKQLKEEYDLQERCGKRCEEWFKKNYNGMNCFYKNHYNNKMNKCFILINCNEGMGQTQNLWDVNENNKFGGLSVFKEGSVLCSMLGKECKSKEEWDLLVKPYMEE